MAQGNITQILSSKPDDRRHGVRGSGGHHQVQGAEKRIAAQTGIHRAESFARRGSDPRSEAADRFAATPGRQGAALQTNRGRTCSIWTRNSRGISSTCCRRRFASGRKRPQKLRVEMEVCSASVLRGGGRNACNCASGSPNSKQEIRRVAAAGDGVERRRCDRHESRIHFNEERLREFDSQNAQARSATSPKRRSARRARDGGTRRR